MKTTNLLLSILIGSSLFTSCKKDSQDSPSITYPKTPLITNVQSFENNTLSTNENFAYNDDSLILYQTFTNYKSNQYDSIRYSYTYKDEQLNQIKAIHYNKSKSITCTSIYKTEGNQYITSVQHTVPNELYHSGSTFKYNYETGQLTNETRIDTAKYTTDAGFTGFYTNISSIDYSYYDKSLEVMTYTYATNNPDYPFTANIGDYTDNYNNTFKIAFKQTYQYSTNATIINTNSNKNFGKPYLGISSINTYTSETIQDQETGSSSRTDYSYTYIPYNNNVESINLIQSSSFTSNNITYKTTFSYK